MADDEYVEVEAVVRMPKGARLASSRSTDGYYRGFTARTSERGPEHVEIRFPGADETRRGGAASAAPGAADAHEYVYLFDQEADEDDAEDLLQGLVLLGLIAAAVWAQPRLRRLLTERLIPFLSAKRQQWLERRARRTGARPGTGAADSAASEIGSGKEPKAIGAALRVYEADMNSDEARQHLVELLVAQHFVNEKTRLLADARIADAAVPAELAKAVTALTPEAVTRALESMLKAKPSLVREVDQLLGAGSIGGPLLLEGAALNEVLRLTDPS